MNILFINSIDIQAFGGGERWMIKAARGLLDKGHIVTLASKTGARILDEAEKAGVPTAVLSVHSDISPPATFRIFRYLKKNNIDVLICNLNKDVRVAGLAARMAGTPLVLHRQGIGLCENKRKYKTALKYLTDGIITNTESIRRQFKNYGWFNDRFIKVIYNGIEKKTHVVPFDFARLSSRKKIIFSAGRLETEKGFDCLIAAGKQLATHRNDFMIVIAGEGRLGDDLKALVKKENIEDAVRFIGYVDPLDPYIAGCDIFALSSYKEGMPNVVMEAMALARPVVASEVNGITELMVDNETGFIVPPKDPSALARSLEKLLDDPGLGARFSAAARQRIESRFSYAAMIDNLETYLQTRLNEKRAR
jgi:glycosyltransferase involved in cell wall biosynthesis